MTRLIDTHTHPYLTEFNDPVAVVDDAVTAGVSMMILPNVDASTLQPMLQLHRQRPDNTRVAIGLHPTEVNDRPVDDQLEFVFESVNSTPDIVAIGEVGMDLYWDKTYRDRQMQVFERQLRLGASLNLPVIIHCREALDETLEVISGLTQKPEMVFHSFGGTEADVNRIRQLTDPMFGINGIVTFKNCNLRLTLPAIGLDRIMLETDAPYLAPVPHRGKTNRPALLTHIAAHIADTMGLNIDEISDITTANARRFFNL